MLCGEGNGIPLQYSCLENPVDGGAWWAALHGVVKSRTRLSDFTFPFHFHALEKEMATHSSVVACRIPGMAEPGGLLSTGSHIVGHDWSNLAAAVWPVNCVLRALSETDDIFLICRSSKTMFNSKYGYLEVLGVFLGGVLIFKVLEFPWS